MKKIVTLDCSAMTDPDKIHDLFASKLSFPATYGRNLDALYDMLSSCGPTELTLTHASALAGLFRYGDNLLLAVKDAAQDNPHLTLVIEE